MNKNQVFRAYLIQTQKDLESAVQRYRQITGSPPTRAVISREAPQNLVEWLGNVPGLSVEVEARKLPLDVWLTHDENGKKNILKKTKKEEKQLLNKLTRSVK